VLLRFVSVLQLVNASRLLVALSRPRRSARTPAWRATSSERASKKLEPSPHGAPVPPADVDVATATHAHAEVRGADHRFRSALPLPQCCHTRDFDKNVATSRRPPRRGAFLRT
jgi:hypothetical protein